ncbi:GNAT family N-acetyltransferase [Paenibacillus harenae]|uniref:GNAT family N-acetyltransferase n=1 Tax=Paenibacillus harenae TaxID=306543 RepID=UPI0027D79F7A|nr:GNAT family protein [Paenibacillus harenae]
MSNSSHSICLRSLEAEDAALLLDLRMRNRDFFQPFEPIRDDLHFTLEGQKVEIANSLREAAEDKAYVYGVFAVETDELVGRIALTGIARGPAQHANMGYFIDQRHNGKGYATESVSLCVRKAFEELGLHRVQAGVMPMNGRSMRVLEKAGFRQEGLAQRYIRINGVWEDHVLFAMTVEELRGLKS